MFRTATAFSACVLLSLVSSFARAQTASPQAPPLAAKSPPAAMAPPVAQYQLQPVPMPATAQQLPLQPAVAHIYSVPTPAGSAFGGTTAALVQPMTTFAAAATVPAARQIVIGPGPVCQTVAALGRVMARAGTWQWVIQSAPVAPLVPATPTPVVSTLIQPASGGMVLAAPAALAQPAVQYQLVPVPVPAAPSPALEAAPPTPVVPVTPTPSPQKMGFFGWAKR